MSSQNIEQHLQEKKISEIINPKLLQVPPDVSVKRAVEYMQENKSAYVIVSDNNKALGIFTQADAVQTLFQSDFDWKRPIRDIMTKDPVSLSPNDSVMRAIDIMAEHSSYYIPLINEKQELVGILSVRTLIRALAEFYPAEVYNLPPDPHQVMPTPEGG